MTWSSHFESLVCKLESNEISHFSMTLYAMKWRPTCYKMVLPNSEFCELFVTQASNNV